MLSDSASSQVLIPVMLALAQTACSASLDDQASEPTRHFADSSRDDEPGADGGRSVDSDGTAPKEAATTADREAFESSTRDGSSAVEIVDASPSSSDATDSQACMQLSQDYGPFVCADLDRMTVAHPALQDENGDGKISAGETATLTVKLSDTSGAGFNWYPTVNVTTDDTRVDVSGSTIYYAILPCDTLEPSTILSFAPNIPAGTKIHITVTVASLNENCPNAPSLEFDVIIGG